ncbi:hypothetical protein E2F47_27735 [Mycobacterium eburneum]|nr:hypothetical protein E2F47_27735 [Mycobacterium eburneum]
MPVEDAEDPYPGSACEWLTRDPVAPVLSERPDLGHRLLQRLGPLRLRGDVVGGVQDLVYRAAAQMIGAEDFEGHRATQ